MQCHYILQNATWCTRPAMKYERWIEHEQAMANATTQAQASISQTAKVEKIPSPCPKHRNKTHRTLIGNGSKLEEKTVE